MAKLEEIVKNLFLKNPELKALVQQNTRESLRLAKEKVVELLKGEKDPKTHRLRWHVQTIRNRVDIYYNKIKEQKLKEAGEAHKESEAIPTNFKATETQENKDAHIPTETEKEVSTGEIETTEPSFEPEGTEIHRKRTDPFEKEEISRQKEEPIGDTVMMNYKEMLAENTAFKNTMVKIVADLKKATKEGLGDLQRDIKGLVSKIPEVGIVYDEIELKASTIDVLKENTTIHEFENESDYLDNLMQGKGDEVKEKAYNTLVELVKPIKGGKLLRLFCENGKISYTEIKERKLGRFRVNGKTLLAGIGIGVGIGFFVYWLITLILDALNTVPPVA